jgi:hypothetical protein
VSNTPAEILDDDALLRRVANRPNMVKAAGDVVRPTSAAFKPSSEDGGISVEVRRFLADPTDPFSVLAELPEHGLVELRAAEPRTLGLTVDHDPLEHSPSHANINGLPGLEKPEARRVARQLALASVWVRQPGLGDAA